MIHELYKWLYELFVAIVSFVMGFFGFDLKKRSVTFADDTEMKVSDSLDSSTNVTDATDVTNATDATVAVSDVEVIEAPTSSPTSASL